MKPRNCRISGFARRIVMQKVIGQTNRAQRKADGIADVSFARNSQLATAAAQIRSSTPASEFTRRVEISPR